MKNEKEYISVMEKKKEGFGSKIGFIFAAAGSAVGLGNIWRFPYLAAKYGGGISLLVYIILAITFAWRKRYDMIHTFGDKEFALPISIISIFIPAVYSIVLIFSMNRDPEYGAGNYYNVYMEDY